jgi:hypothetical protein
MQKHIYKLGLHFLLDAINTDADPDLGKPNQCVSKRIRFKTLALFIVLIGNRKEKGYDI